MIQAFVGIATVHMIQRRTARQAPLSRFLTSVLAGLALTASSIYCTAASTPAALPAINGYISDSAFSTVAQDAVAANDAHVTVIADAVMAPDETREANKPRYPEQALRDRIEGYVVVQFDITRTGAVSGVRVIEAQPANYFETAAINAVQKFRFSPNDNTTEPVAIRGAINRFVFSLHAPNIPAKPGFIFHRGRTYYALAP